MISSHSRSTVKLFTHVRNENCQWHPIIRSAIKRESLLTETDTGLNNFSTCKWHLKNLSWILGEYTSMAREFLWIPGEYTLIGKNQNGVSKILPNI